MSSVHALPPTPAEVPTEGTGAGDRLRLLVEEIVDDPEARSAAEAALERILEQRQSSLRRLTEAEFTALERMGVSAQELEQRTALAALQQSSIQARSVSLRTYTAAEVALLLGVSPARIRQRAADGSLLAQRRSNGWHFPVFQFPDGREPGGWATVARVIPRDLPLLVIERALHTPLSRLSIDGRKVSPLDWLLRGGDPQLAAGALTDDLTRIL